MANQNIQASIVLSGPGHVARPRGDYRKGEYRRLVNSEIVEDRIVNRRNVNGPNYTIGDGISGISQRDISFGPLGFWNHWTVFSGLGWQTAYDSNGNVRDMFIPSDVSLPTALSPGAPDYGHLDQFVGFFQYNLKNYWIRMHFNPEDTYFAYHMYSSDDSTDDDSPPNNNPTYIQYYDNVIQVTYDDPDFSLSNFKNFMVFKERLWIVTEGIVYFSAATDPTDFAVDSGGGFFRFPGEHINYAMAIGDYIYVLCKGSVYTITYSDDPNEDAVTRIVSDNIGGIHGCIFKSEPYFINNEGLFLINNNYIEKVFNTDFDEGLNLYPRQTITPFNNYLVINKNYEANSYGYLSPEDSDSDYGLRVNMISNPNLETDITGWFATSGSTAAHQAGIAGAPAGTDVLQITRTAASGSASVGFTTPITNGNRIEVEPGKAYTFSFYASRPTTVDAKTVDIDVIPYINDVLQGAGSVIVDAAVVQTPVAPPVLPTGTWARYSIRFIAATATEVELHGFFNGAWLAGEVVYFDAFLLEQTDSVSTYFDNTLTSDIFGWQYVKHANGKHIALNPSFKYDFGLVPFQYAIGDDPNGNDSGYNTYFVNMENGSTHVLDFKPIYSDIDNQYKGYIGHIAVNPNLNNDNPAGTVLFLGTSDILNTNIGELGNHHVWYMNYELSDEVRDHVVTYAGADIWASDDFNEPDNALTLGNADIGGAWLDFGSGFLYGIQNNQAYPVNTGATENLKVIETGVSSCVIELTIETMPANGWAGIVFRNDNTRDEGFAVYSDFLWDLGALDDVPGVPGTIFAEELVSGDRCRVVLDLNDITIYRQAGAVGSYVQIYSTTSSSYNTNTKHGFYIYGHSASTARFDDFIVYTEDLTGNRLLDDPKILIELSGFTPDGSEYLVKKFRTLELMGKFPRERFEIQFSYNNENYGTARDLNDDESLLVDGELRLHLPHRLGLNQRGRSFNLKFRTNSEEPLNELYDFLEISNIRVLWAYTQRAHKYASFNPAI